MFDDLHDPDPPNAGMAALASVSRRARQLRRRRSLMLGSAGVAVVTLAVAAVVLPEQDRSSVAPADSGSTSLPLVDDPVPECGAVTDPVWLPNGELPGTPEQISGIDPFTGERVDGRTWSDPDGFGLLVQLPASADVVDLPASGRMWDLRVRDARPAADSVEVTIWRRAGNCAARYLVPGDVEAATTWGATFVDQLTAAASATGPFSDDEGVCPVILGERVACLPTASIQSGAMLGPVAATFVHLESGDSGDPAATPQGLGVIHVVIGAGDVLSPRSRLSFESPIDGTALKSVVDLVPLRDVWCGSVRRSDGNLALFELQASSATGGDAAGQTTADVRCDDPSDEAASSSTIAITTAPTSTAVSPSTSVPSSSVGTPVVAIDANGDAVAFLQSGTPTVVIDDSDPDDIAPPENPSVLDQVVALPGGSGYVVGGCCEAPNGYLLLAEPSNISGGGRYIVDGRLPALTDSGNLVWAGPDGVVLGAVDGSISMTLLELDPAEWTVRDLAVVQRGSGLEEVLVLASGPDGTSLIRVFAVGGDMRLTQQVSDLAAENAQLSLAGWREDAFYVLDGANDRMLAFDAEDLQPTASDVRTSEGEVVRWRSAWLTPTLPRHVEENGELWVGDSSWGGEYVWVR